MTPQLAIDITARDKTEKGTKEAEKRLGKVGANAEKSVSGTRRLADLVKGFSRLGKIEFGAEGVARLGEMSKAANENVGGLARSIFSLGVQGPGAMGAIAEGAVGVAGASAAAAAAVIGVGAAVYALGDKWAKTGGQIGRNAKSLGVSNQFLQSARAENERFGVTVEQTDASLDNFTSTLYDARYGANNLALGAMKELGVSMKIGANNAIDYADAYNQVIDAIAREKDPGVQKKLAGVFGLSAALPAIREGSAKLGAEGKDYLGSGAALSDDQVAKAEDVERKTVRLRQHLGALEKKAGMAALEAAGGIADHGVDLLHPSLGQASKVWDEAKGVAHDISRAGDKLVGDLERGGRDFGRAVGDEFKRFTDRIEHQESRGHQFDRRGNPLVSNRGAVGDMQVLEETGRRAAARAGIPWDREAFYGDKVYNKRIGTEELWRLSKKYSGDEVLTAAAYNAGEGNVDKWLKRFGDPRKGQISDEAFAADIPFKETRDYVQKTAAAHLTVDFHNAPAGTVVTTQADPGVHVDVGVHRALEGTP